MSSANVATATVGFQVPTVDDQHVMEMTREYFVMQTIVALQQLTNTPTPATLANLPNPWTEIITITTTLTPFSNPTTFPNSTVALVKDPNTPVRQGPGNSYLSTCYVNDGIQLKIVGRNNDSTWLKVMFSPGQTCFVLGSNATLKNITPDPAAEYWVSRSACTIFGSLVQVPIVTPAATPTATRHFIYTPIIPTNTHQPGGSNNPTATNTPVPTSTPVPPPTNTPVPPPTNTPVPPPPDTPTSAPPPPTDTPSPPR